MIPELVIVALEFYREPRRFPYLTDPRYPLPAGVTDLLTAPANELSDEHIEKTAATLNATVNECREMVPFFIKQVLLDSGGDYYRILGLPRNAETSQIKKHYQYLIRLFHPDKDISDDNWDDLYAPRINEAYDTLRNSGKRSEYDARLSAEDNVGFAPAAVRQPAAQTRTRHNMHAPVAEKATMSPQAKKLALGLVTVVFIGFTMLILKESHQPTLRVVVDDESAIQVNTPTNVEQAVLKTDSLQAAEATVLQQDIVQQADESKGHETETTAQQADQSLEEMIRSRVEQATVAVVGSPVAAVPGRARKAESPKLVSPGPEKPSITKVEEQKPSVKKNTVVSNTDVAEKEVVRKDVVNNKEAVSSKKVAVSNEVVASKSSNPPTNSVTSQQDDQRSVPQSITQSLPQVVPENHQQNSPSITPEQLFKLLAVLMSSYEAGDLERFVDLFAEDAGTTDGNGKPKIYKLYKEYFARPEQRKISITQFRWKDNGSNAKNGSGNVHLVTIPLDGSEPTNGGGPLRLDVQLYPEGLKIKGMYYKIKTK